MKNVFVIAVLSFIFASTPLLSQEKNNMPMKDQTPMREGVPRKDEAKQGGGMDMQQMKEIHGKMMEMHKGMGHSTMKADDMKGMGSMMEHMSGMMGDMGHMMQGGR